MATTNVEVVVAIDLGTTYSGYAWSTKVNFQEDPLKVWSNELWPNGETLTERTPTAILFNPKEEFKFFGYEAEDEYAKLAENGEEKNWYYFRRFKMELFGHNQRKIRRQLKICDETKKQMSAMKVFSESIRFFVNHFRDMVKRTETQIKENEIKWVVTVPAIWDDGAKQFMREAANMAGIPNDQLELALEPEGAAIFSIKDMYRGAKLYPLSPNPTVMVLDCGGGTVDITVCCVVEKGALKQVCTPTGGPWGGITVDKAFVSLLEEIFGKAIFQNFKDIHSIEYIDLMRSFEIKKRKFKDDTMVIRISEDLISSVGEEGDGKSLEKKISLSKYWDTITFKANTRRLHIEPTVIRELFAEARTNIIQQIKELLAKHSEIKTVLTVGGFSASEVIYQAIKEACSSTTVVRPQIAEVAVVKGAVIYGHDKLAIISRKSRFTYGINCAIPFDETIHPEYTKTIKADRILFQEALKVFIRAEDIVIPEQTKVIHEFHPANPDDKVATIDVYRSTIRDPPCIKGICTQIGRMLLNLETHDGCHGGHGIKSDGIVEIIMYFGYTELKVEARERGTNNKKEAKYDFL